METEPESVFSLASFRKKLIVTFIIYYANIVLAATPGFIGPSLIHFEKKLEEDTETVSRIVSVSNCGYVIGSFAFLVASKYIGRQLSAIFFLTVLTIPPFVLPHVNNIWLYYALGGISGFGSGGYDPAQISWIIDIWRHKCGPYVLAEHFAYSVGTILPPLILAPFLSDEEEEDSTTEATTTTTTTSTGNYTVTEDPDRIWIPFGIGGLLGVIAVVSQIIMLLHFQRLKRNINESTSSVVAAVETTVPADDAEKPEVTEDRSSVLRLLLLTCLFLGGYQGLEMTCLAFLPTFAAKSSVKVSESYAARAFTACTAAYATGRLVGILMILKIAAEYILIGNFLFILGGTFVLFFMGTSRALLWLGNILLGFGFSSVYPTYFAYIEKYLLVSDFRAGIFTICGGTIAVIHPFIIGQSIDENPNIMLYICFASCAVVFVAFSNIYYFTKWRNEKQSVD